MMSLNLARVRRALPLHGFKAYSQSSSSSPSLRNAVFRGIVIGGTAAGSFAAVGFSIYYFSVKKIVDTAQPAMGMLSKSRENLAKHASRQALHYLRAAAKAYVATVPFAAFFVDQAFDAAEDIVDAHSAEATVIIQRAYDDIYRIIQERGNEHRTSGSIQIVAAVRHLLKELKGLGSKSGLETSVSKVVSYASTVSESVRSNAPTAYAGMKNKVQGIFPPKPHSEEDSAHKSVEGGVTDARSQVSSVFESMKSNAPSAFEKIKNKVQDIVVQKHNSKADPSPPEPTQRTDKK